MSQSTIAANLSTTTGAGIYNDGSLTVDSSALTGNTAQGNGGALFIDGYALIYRYLVAHQPIGTQLTSIPNIGGHNVYLPRGLDLQGGTELVIAVCKGPNNPPGAGCRQGPPNGASVASAQQATLPILRQRVNSLGVSEAVVAAQGDDQILVQLPGVGLQQAVATVGATLATATATAELVPVPPSLSVTETVTL